MKSPRRTIRKEPCPRPPDDVSNPGLTDEQKNEMKELIREILNSPEIRERIKSKEK